MTEIEDLAARLKRLRITEEGIAWNSDPLISSGLPGALSPFYVAREFEPGYVFTGLHSVCAGTKTKGVDEVVIFSGLESEFAAFRKMVDAYEAWRMIRPIERVYFIGTELRAGVPIKVGFSTDPEARLRNLQTAHSEPLQIFATVPGGKALEAKYHSRWRARRKTGEWFTLGDCILNEISRLQHTQEKSA